MKELSEGKGKYIVLTIAIIVIGLSIAGGTYAWLTQAANVTNANYNVSSHCFSVEYTINNQDNTQDITGTLFPGSGPSKGLSGRVGLKTGTGCSLNANGTLKLHLNSGTSTRFGTVAEGHCENEETYETLNDYTTSSECFGHGTWTTTSTVLKYAVYDNSTATGSPLGAGYITTSDIGADKIIAENLPITTTQAYYYIFIWLDGYLTDNTYTELPLSGYIKAEATQRPSS